MKKRAASARNDFRALARAAIALGAGFVASSCAGERTEPSPSSTAALRVDGDTPADGSGDPPRTGAFCPDPSSYFIEVTGDAATTTLRSSCANATRDFGAVGAVGGPFSSYSRATTPQVLLEACSDRSRDAAKISIVVGNKNTPGSVYFRDPQGTVFLSLIENITDSGFRVGPLGGTIEGTYAATLYTAKPDGLGQIQGPVISGAFRVCHLQDVDLTPVR